MKNVLIIATSFGLGYALNTEPGKRLRIWASEKAQEQINNILGKINEIGETKDSPDTEEKK